MPASKIMVIRHAEKPAETGAPYGVLPTGEQDGESLIVQGWQRAGALASLFAPTEGPLQSPDLATPQFLFASGSKSRRPQQTIAPLGAKRGIAVDTAFKKGDEKHLVDHAKACDGIVLICWQHEDIPEIGNYIVGDRTAVPQKWDGSRFDLVWVFDRQPATGTWRFTQVPQMLLAGDSTAPITGR